MPFVVCCALVYFWTLRFSRIGDFYTLRLGFFGNLDLRIIELFIWQTGTRGLLFKKRFKLEFILKKGAGNDIPAPFFLWRTIFT